MRDFIRHFIISALIGLCVTVNHCGWDVSVVLYQNQIEVKSSNRDTYLLSYK